MLALQKTCSAVPVGGAVACAARAVSDRGSSGSVGIGATDGGAHGNVEHGVC